MTWDHDRVEELLAGQALGTLDPDDADLAERALVEHLPVCDRCRRALDDYRALAGDLALAALPASPPEPLVKRLRREIRSRPRLGAPRWLAAGAAAAALLALAGWNLALAGRLDSAEDRQALMVEAMAAVGRADASVVAMRGSPGVRAAMIYVRENHEAYFVASGLPEGRYHLWLVGGGGWHSLGAFAARDGVAVLRSTAEADDVQEVVVTWGSPTAGVRPADLPAVIRAAIPDRGS